MIPDGPLSKFIHSNKGDFSEPVENVRISKFAGLEYDDENGNDIYQIRTSNNIESVSTHYTMKNIGNMIITLHSHSRLNGNDNASGTFGSGRYYSDATTEVSDYDTYIRLNGNYQTIHKKQVVPHILYNARTKKITEYNWEKSSLGHVTMHDSNDMFKYIKKKIK